MKFSYGWAATAFVACLAAFLVFGGTAGLWIGLVEATLMAGLFGTFAVAVGVAGD